jgi:hypothetical protein
MRYGLLVLGIGLCIGLYQGCFARAYDTATTAVLTEEARLAMDLRCQGQHGRARSDCRAMLKKLYLSRSLDPDKTLRAYCDSIKNARWGGSRPPPPEVCVKRYGGWQEG